MWTLYRIRTGYPLDDAFITFTYARNVARGWGFSYNGAPPFLGTTSPLLTLLLAFLKILMPSQEIYVLGIWLSGILWAVGVILSFLLGRVLGDERAGLTLAFAYATHSLLPWVNGFEYALLLVLNILAIMLTVRGHIGMAGIVLGLSFLARGDSALLAAVLGGTWLLLHRRIPWRMILGFLIPVLPWMIYGYWTFGNPLPATLRVKLAHRALGAWPHIAKGFWMWFTHTGWRFQAYVYMAVGLALLGIALFIRHRKWWHLAIIGWGGAYVLAYLVINVPFYFWYITPALTSLILFAGLTGWAMPAAVMRSTKIPHLLRYGLATASLALYLAFIITGAKNVITSASSLQRIPSKLIAYREAGLWLAENTPPGATAAFIEVGVLGYFSDRPIIDILGLTYPNVLKYIKSGELFKILEDFKPDYYIRNTNFDTWGMSITIHESSFFKEHYVEVASFPVPGKKPVIVYRYEEMPHRRVERKAEKKTVRKVPHSVWILGDSITIGLHASAESATYRNRLIAKLQSHYPGQIYTTLWAPVCTWKGLEAWWNSQNTYPDVLFLEVGLVDVLARTSTSDLCVPTPQSEWPTRIGDMLDTILRSKDDIQVVVGTVPWCGWEEGSDLYTRAQRFNDILRKEAEKRHIPVADLWAVTVGDRDVLSRPDRSSAFGPDFRGDYFHPGDTGHQRIAEAFWQAFQSAYGK